MRILTKSPFNAKGLISIVEAGDNAPQTVVFCVPIDVREAEKMRNIFDFENYFYEGISTKIKDQEETNTIDMDYWPPIENGREISLSPKFVANIRGHKVEFYLSHLNFLPNSKYRLNIDFFYSGEYLNDEFHNKRLLILEPNWSQLDRLFLEKNVVFTDW